jgi:hypothetical protein
MSLTHASDFRSFSGSDFAAERYLIGKRSAGSGKTRARSGFCLVELGKLGDY